MVDSFRQRTPHPTALAQTRERVHAAVNRQIRGQSVSAMTHDA